ncbi:uncharacterized protein LOC131844769 [Achroia grisella]|uniref:uncharacterized protein LOC131844769 n=1 Tax=Achroia grisella TaxID=688607 RepID=UPI0027D2C133|nr:uncharacterized protein LOC131844769 [Achroia grisella]
MTDNTPDIRSILGYGLLVDTTISRIPRRGSPVSRRDGKIAAGAPQLPIATQRDAHVPQGRRKEAANTPTRKQCIRANIVQVNLHHAMAATAVIENLFRKNDLDLTLIQEPWLNKATPLGLNASGNILFNTTGTKPRACILFNKKLDFLTVPELCTDDLVTAFVNFPGCTGSKVLVCSAYLPGHDENNKIIKDPTTGLQPVVEYARKHKAELLVGCDANAHHTNWGSSDINTRAMRTPCLITSTSDSQLRRNRLKPHFYRNPKATDWPKYRDSLTSIIAELPKSIKSPLELELAVDILLSGIISAYQNNCPIKTKTAKCKTPWWNKSLEKLRKKTRKLSNRAKKNGPNIVKPKRNTTAKLESQKSIMACFLRGITQTPQGSRLHKMLAKAYI